MKMLFVFNPKSGRGQIRGSLTSVIDIFVKGGYEVTVHPTQSKGDAKNKIVQCGDKFDAVVVGGGDGTLNEAINAIMHLEKEKRPYLGYIPSGTTNDFATSNNIPKGNVKKAAQNIVDGNIDKIDVGKFNNEYFSYIAAFGAFTEVSYGTNQQAKNVLGYSAYLLEGIKSIANIKPHRVKIEYDDKIIEDDFIYGMVSNSFSVGGVKYNSGIDVSLNDGIFECVFVRKPANPIDLQFTIADLLTNNIKSDKFIVIKTSKISFTSLNEIDWTVDGEYGGKLKKVKITNCHNAVKMICGKR